jgi:hypothetical protein
MVVSRWLFELDERARQAYARTPTWRLVIGLALTFAVVGFLVGLLIGYPFYFLAAMGIAGAFPLFVVATSKTRRR